MRAVLTCSLLLAALTLSLLLGACAAPPPTLYARLGGEKTLTHLVDRTLNRAAADPRTQRSFAGLKLVNVKKSLVRQLCALSGGDCVYEGPSMARAHQDLKITDAEFDAFMDILREEMDQAGLATPAKLHLLKLLAPMKQDIVRPVSG